jgi:hypothetical protein
VASLTAASVRVLELGARPASESENACTSPSATVVSSGGDERQEAIDVGAVSALGVWRSAVQPHVDELMVIGALPLQVGPRKHHRPIAHMV